MKLRFLFFFILFALESSLFAIPTTAPAATQASASSTIGTSAPVRVSFIQTAMHATLESIPGQPNTYTLTLYNISPYITYYLNRPNRATGLATVKNYVAAWGSGADNMIQDNPNAVIYAGQINGQPNQALTSYVVQISNPNFTPSSNQISYVVSALGKQGFVLDKFDLDYVVLIIN